ncbi:MAG: DUF2029 domain-containing protein [Clostridia bacterium]|nr:DUF2029 domain-containing protein [Clostridia bacterium]
MNKDFVSDKLRGALGKKCPLWARALLLAAATIIFFVFAEHARYRLLDEYSSIRYDENLMITAIAFTAIFAVSAAVQLHMGRELPLGVLLLLCAVTGAVLLGKISLLDYNSDDYDIFLHNWINTYSGLGFKEGLGTYIGSDYTPPYLYILQLISRVPEYPWQYLIKAVSVFAEILMGVAVFSLARLKMRGEAGPLLVYHAAQVLPTVIFNGAYWGQCDVIYVSFCLLALYLALAKKPVRGMICFGVALSFKLQTVFFLPALLPLWLRRDVKLRHVLAIPAAYMAMMIPALWGGKSMHHVLTCYLQQAGQYNFISVNAPSLYQLLPMSVGKDVLYKMFGSMALALGFAMMAVVCVVVVWRRDALNTDAVLLACLLTLGGVPLFLPKMHERYMFGADVLSLVAAVYAPRRLLLPLCFGMASYICYTAGLAGDTLMELRFATLFMITGVVLTAVELWRVLNRHEAIAEVKA